MALPQAITSNAVLILLAVGALAVGYWPQIQRGLSWLIARKPSTPGSGTVAEEPTDGARVRLLQLIELRDWAIKADETEVAAILSEAIAALLEVDTITESH